ncbi:hypothetical protein IW19_01235 [Flavobacterium reichenbachii]|uniref:Uncharacterized protein n=2 Tax=Flavobacterium reichenbachii TaxID=362418 RepID=A0A085ZIG5_9FLAO|nr:hypothetical protein IW19_01235 [Flavobacterium reichenbachii]
MIKIFQRKTKVKDIQLFEFKAAELLSREFPEIKECLGKGKLKIYFSKTGILLLRQSTTGEIRRTGKIIFFELSGIYLLEKKTQEEKEIKLFYQNNVLHQIKVDQPETFYKDYDLNLITKKEVSIRNISIQNPDLKIVSKILSSLNKEQLQLLDLEDTFEIEVNEKLYYPILDFENGNYIAVDKKGKIYRLNHDHEENIKEIFKNVHEFLEVYKGVKSDLEIYFE